MVGEYSVALPDGRIQHVKYNADTIHGNVMEVTYEGEAQHPDLHFVPVIDEEPEPAISSLPPLGGRFQRDATLPSLDLDDYKGFISFSDDIKPFVDFGLGRYREEDYDYNDYAFDDYDYDLILDRNQLQLVPSPRTQRSLQSLLDDPLFREFF